MDKTNENKPETIFGTVTTIPAKDAAYLPVRPLYCCQLFILVYRDDGRRRAAGSRNSPEQYEGIGGATIFAAACTSCHGEKGFWCGI